MTKPSTDNAHHTKIGCPRTIVRVWGMVAAISYISTGGYVVSMTDANQKCIGAGAYMILIGIITLFVECPICFIFCPPEANCFEKCDKTVPYWVKGIIYILLSLPCLGLCFGIKTLLSSLLYMILALLYFFLVCIERSKRYERLRGEVKAQYKQKKGPATVGYSSLGAATATINQFKVPPSAKQKNRPKGGRKEPNYSKKQSTKA